MKLKTIFSIALMTFLLGCSVNLAESSVNQQKKVSNRLDRKNVSGNSINSSEKIKKIVFKDDKTVEITSFLNNKKPKTVRDFFMILPEKYFSIECCENKEEYLKRYLTVEDTKNGYLEGGGDAAQNTFKMVLFKRPDKTYIIGFNSSGEAEDSYYFLEYKDDKWFDISTDAVPEYSKKNIYEFPRYGTTIKVFAKNVIDSDGEFELTEKGRKLYDLIWSKGKFDIKK